MGLVIKKEYDDFWHEPAPPRLQGISRYYLI